MTAKAGDAAPSKQEILQLVYDSSLRNNDTGRDLVLQYLDYVEDESAEEFGFDNDADFDKFKEQLMNDFHISGGDIGTNNLVGGMFSDVSGWDDLEEDVESAYSNAKKLYDQGQESSRNGDKAANDDARNKLNDMAGRATETNPGVATSDEILDLGSTSMKSFDVFGPLYGRAQKFAPGSPPVEPPQRLRELYDEQRKIPFGKFSEGANEFARLKDAISKSGGDAAGEVNKNLANWQGAGADKAKSYQKNYEAKVKSVADGADHAAQAMMKATGTVAAVCRSKVDWIIKWRYENVFPMTAQDLDRVIRIAELGDRASEDDFKHCAKFLDDTSKSMINDESCDLNDATITHIVDEVKKYLQGNFCPSYSKYVNDFKQMCTNTHTGVDGAWKLLSDFLMSLEENPFQNLDQASKEPDGGFKEGGGGQDTGGGGKNGGGGTQPPNIGPTPKPPEMPEMPKPPEATDPAMNPVTHQPLETNPDTGQPYPIDPKTGEAIKSDTTQPETMTVEQGDNKISMAEPDKDGKMGISVDDGTGHPKDYKLDFGDDKAKPLADGTPQFGPQGAPQPGAEPNPAQQPPGGQRAQDTAGQTYQPGPDGKIHIENGNLKITAERPDGPDGPTQVTVDDGSGHPTKYTLGENDGKPGTADGAATPAEPGAGRHAVDGARHAVGDQPAGTPVERMSQPQDGLSGQQQDHRSPEVTTGGTGGGAHSAPSADGAGQHAEPVGATASAGDSTSPQSLSNPMDSSSSAAPDSGLGEAGDVDAANAQGGGTGGQSSTGMGAAPGGTDQHGQPAGAPAGMMGGGMMGGGMGAGAGAGGGGGEDQQRNASAYRVDGGLFDTATTTGNRISGSLDDDSVIGLR